MASARKNTAMTLILENRKLPQLCAHLWQWDTLVPSFSSQQPVNSKQEHLVPQNKPPAPGNPCSHARFSLLCSVSSGTVYEEQPMKVTDRRVSAAFHLLPLFSTSLLRLFSPRSPSICTRSLRPSVSRGCWLSSVSQSSNTTSEIKYCWPHSVHTSNTLTHTHPLLRCSTSRCHTLQLMALNDMAPPTVPFGIASDDSIPKLLKWRHLPIFPVAVDSIERS